jgi:curved DNA-binding protein CbpA
MNQNQFVDYYEDLQVSPNADTETIERIYRLFAKRYHPDNSTSGDAEKFNIITEAYRLLSDPEKRAAYDAKHEEEKIRQYKAVSNISSSEGFETDQSIRHQILSILYIERRREPFESGVGLWRLEKLLGWPEKILDFHTWYLKEKGWIQRTETGGYSITASGVDVVEENDLILGQDRLLPEPVEIAANSETPKNENEERKRFLKIIQPGSPQISPVNF